VECDGTEVLSSSVRDLERHQSERWKKKTNREAKSWLPMQAKIWARHPLSIYDWYGLNSFRSTRMSCTPMSNWEGGEARIFGSGSEC